MNDDQHRTDQDQHPEVPASETAGGDDLGGAEVQQAQDEAGIAGEPQPVDDEGSD